MSPKALRRLSTLQKRAMLHAPDAPRETLLAYAEQYLDDGYLYEAMEFFEKAREQSGLDRVRDAAVAEGDATLLAWMARNALADVTPEHWRTAGENALKAGKICYADAAFERAGDSKRAAELRDANTKANQADAQATEEVQEST